MFNHRAIMQDAWTRYRKARAISAANGFPALPHRTLIANCLRTAWQVAKALARAAQLAAVIAEPLTPEQTELLRLENKTRWRPVDYQRARQLRHEMRSAA